MAISGTSKTESKTEIVHYTGW